MLGTVLIQLCCGGRRASEKAHTNVAFIEQMPDFSLNNYLYTLRV